jgi:hypothetical protein
LLIGFLIAMMRVKVFQVLALVVQDAGGAVLFVPLLSQFRTGVVLLALQLIELLGAPLSPSAPSPVLPGVPRPEPGHPSVSNVLGVWSAVSQSVQQMMMNEPLSRILVPWLQGPLQCQVNASGHHAILQCWNAACMRRLCGACTVQNVLLFC